MTNAVNIAQSGSNNQTFRNRIINGAMVIDQRNAGASVAMTTSEVYSIDRFFARFSAGVYSATQGQSSVAPAGFTNSLLINVTTGGTVTAAVRGLVSQRIEGYNWADLGYGAAGAASSTLSFWVRSSLTGTFSGALQNNAGDRSYAFTYTISAANTWEYKTIAVSGDTSGTWLTTNGGGISIGWDLGNGSDLKTATTGSWLAGDFRGVTGSVAPFATSGATWYITGVQLEEGTAASPFENRLYGTELELCQRYCQVIAKGNEQSIPANWSFSSSSEIVADLKLSPTMRATPSLIQTATSYRVNSAGLNQTATTTISFSSTESTRGSARLSVGGFSGASAGQGATLRIYDSGSGTYMGFSAEL